MKINNANVTNNNLLTKQAEQAWESLTLASNFIFCKVMTNKQICIKILSEILGEEVIDVEYPEYEKTLQVRYDAKSIRLDVYVKGHDDTVYNIEMQNIGNDSIPKRGRYYQDLIDLDLLEKGAHYSELNKSIVIFICTFDLYGYEQYKYTFTNKCKEIDGLEYGDETTKIIVNTYGTQGEVSDDLKDFLKAVNHQFSNSDFSAKIKAEVEKVKDSNNARREFMTLYLHEEDIRRESLKLGREEGLIEGTIRGKAEDIIELLEDLGEITQELKDKIYAQTDLALLTTWLKLAAKADSLEDFLEKTELNR